MVDTLRALLLEDSWCYLRVLILVLMEDTLRDRELEMVVANGGS